MVYSTRRFVLCLSVCHFVLVFFSPFSIVITSLGEERANLSAFRTFVRFVLVWICRFSLPLGVWEGLRFVIVAPPGLFSYLFFQPYQLTSKTRAHYHLLQLFVSPKIFSYKNVLQGLNTENITRNPSAFCYNPACNIITGDLNIVRISKLRDIFSKGPKYREPKSFTWKQNSKLILDSVEEFARRWAKKEDVEIDTLSEWVKSVMSLVNRRVSVLRRTMSRRHESAFDDPDVAAE